MALKKDRSATLRIPYLGIVFVLLSAVAFSTAGVLIKLNPLSPLSVNGARCLVAAVIVYIYMRATGRHMRANRWIVLGALINTVMLETFVGANKLTSAANAIVLQFSEPLWVIALGFFIFRNRPKISALICCAGVLSGIVCFFFDEIGPGVLAGNLLAILSGLAYAGVFLIKKMPETDFECAAILSFLACFFIGIPFYLQERYFDAGIAVNLFLLGALQLGLAYILLSKGLDSISPVTASLTSTIEPILNPILVALILGQSIGALAMFGAVLVIGSAFVYNIYQAKQGR